MNAPEGRRRLTGWDLAAILALGAAGSALSYDALRQMAVAIHVRPQLTYLFPLLLDGFIAYGVRAVVLLRRAALHARAYAWTLFSAATAASVWANALHAVTLNNEAAQQPTTGLRLSNLTVGILSTLAPLALGGAVHLYIVIARHHSTEDDPDSQATHRKPDAEGTAPLQAGTDADQVRTVRRPARGRAPARPLDTRSATAVNQVAVNPFSSDRPQPQPGQETATTPAASGGQPTGPGPHTTPATPAAPHPHPHQPALPAAEEPDDATVTPAPDPGGDQTGRKETESWGPGTRAEVLRRPALTARKEPDDLKLLLPIARDAAAQAGRLNRAVVADGIRASGYRISNERVTAVMRALRSNPSTNPPAKPAGRHRR